MRRVARRGPSRAARHRREDLGQLAASRRRDAGRARRRARRGLGFGRLHRGRPRSSACAATACQQTRCEVVTYGVSADEARRFGLPCGGTIQLVLEPLHARVRHSRAAARDRGRAPDGAPSRPRDRARDAASGARDRRPRLSTATSLTTIHGPRYRMLVIGASQLSKYLAQIAVGLDYQVTVCDPREEYTETWDVPGVTLVRTMPDDTVHRDAARRALRGRRADARSEARRPRADGGAEVAGVLRRRARLAREQRQAPRAAARIRPDATRRSRGCTGRSACTSAAARRRRSRSRSWPRSPRSRTASIRDRSRRSRSRRRRSSRRPLAARRLMAMHDGAPLRYQSGFGSELASEALEGALPVGRNSPQRAPYGLVRGAVVRHGIHGTPAREPPFVAVPDPACGAARIVRRISAAGAHQRAVRRHRDVAESAALGPVSIAFAPDRFHRRPDDDRGQRQRRVASGYRDPRVCVQPVDGGPLLLRRRR